MSMKAHHSEYKEMLTWIQDALWHTRFTPERLRVSVQRMLSDIPSHKRNGSRMAACVLNNMHFNNPDYNTHAGNIMRQAVHLAKVRPCMLRLSYKVSEGTLAPRLCHRFWRCSSQTLTRS